jgi:KDO2-lipid IV(A) lauroyltransferase
VARFKKKLKNHLIYGFISLIVKFFNVLPRKIGILLGSSLGALAYQLYRTERNKAERHLCIAFGESLSGSERKIIIHRMFKNIMMNFVDVIRLPKYYKSELRPLIEIEGIEHFEQVYNRGRGLVAVTGHIGNFELLAAFAAGEGYKSAAVGRELYDSRLNKLLVSNREKVGVMNVDTKDSPLRIMKLLKDGYALGVLIDTDSTRVRGEMIPFFGRPANTPVGQSIIGLKAGAGFVPIVCIRSKNGYKIIIKPEVTIIRTDDFDADMYNITKKCTEVLEEIITEYKDQWIWLHDRWRTKPESKK